MTFIRSLYLLFLYFCFYNFIEAANLSAPAKVPKHKKNLGPISNKNNSQKPTLINSANNKQGKPLAGRIFTPNSEENTASVEQSSETSSSLEEKKIIPKSITLAECRKTPSAEELFNIPWFSSLQVDVKGKPIFLKHTQNKTELVLAPEPGKQETLAEFKSHHVIAIMSPDKQRLMILEKNPNGPAKVSFFDLASKKIQAATLEATSALWHPNSQNVFFTSPSSGFSTNLFEMSVLTPQKTSLKQELPGDCSLVDISKEGTLISLEQKITFSRKNILIWNTQKSETVVFDHYLSQWNPHFTSNNEVSFFFSESNITKLGTRSLSEEKTKTPLLLTELDKSFSDHRSSLFLLNQEGYSLSIQPPHQNRNLLSLSNAEPSRGVIRDVALKNSGYFMIETAPSMPDRIYFKEGNKEELWISASDFSPSCFNKENLIRYPSFDGKTISAFYFPSKNNHPSKKALVFVKEGPHDPFRPTFRADIQYWIQNGWSLLIPNYRGTTSYGIDFEEADDGEKRLQSAHDISSALKWLEKMGTPLKNSAVLGEGYGATLALLSLDFSPKPFAFVGLNGSLDWGEFTEKKSLLENTLWKKELGSEQDLKNLTLESRLKKTSIPILWESVEYPTLTSLRKSMSFLDRSFSQPLNSK